jgi:hypothetical protein
VIRILRNQRGWGADYRFRVELESGGERRVIYSHARDSMLGLTEVYWSDDSNLVGLLVCNRISGPIFVNYNISRRELLPPEAFRPVLRAQILKHYADASRARDIFEWACSLEGTRAFQGLPPGPSQ